MPMVLKLQMDKALISWSSKAKRFVKLYVMGIGVYITGRSVATASKRAADLWVDVYDREKHGQCDLFVNAAPVTDEPLKNAVNFLAALEGCSLVFDHELVGTELVKYCRANN